MDLNTKLQMNIKKIKKEKITKIFKNDSNNNIKSIFKE